MSGSPADDERDWGCSFGDDGELDAAGKHTERNTKTYHAHARGLNSFFLLYCFTKWLVYFGNLILVLIRAAYRSTFGFFFFVLLVIVRY